MPSFPVHHQLRELAQTHVHWVSDAYTESTGNIKIIRFYYLPFASNHVKLHLHKRRKNISCCFIVKSCLTLCDLMDCSMPGFPVLHYLPEFAQIHMHWVGDAIWPSLLLPSSSPFAFNLSQHQCLLQWVSSSHQVAKVLKLQHQSANEYSELISFRIDWFDLLAVWSWYF